MEPWFIVSSIGLEEQRIKPVTHGLKCQHSNQCALAAAFNFNIAMVTLKEQSSAKLAHIHSSSGTKLIPVQMLE